MFGTQLVHNIAAVCCCLVYPIVNMCNLSRCRVVNIVTLSGQLCSRCTYNTAPLLNDYNCVAQLVHNVATTILCMLLLNLGYNYIHVVVILKNKVCWRSRPGTAIYGSFVSFCMNHNESQTACICTECTTSTYTAGLCMCGSIALRC